MRRPLIYYCNSLLLGTLTGLLLLNKSYLGAAIAASFLVIIFLTIDRKYCFFMIAFFILGTCKYIEYFSLNISNDKYINIRITEKTKFYNEGTLKGRRIELTGNLDNCLEGELVYIKGKYLLKPDYENGVIGVYEVEDLKKGKSDILHQLYKFKRLIYIRFSKQLGEEHAAILTSACFGDTSHLDSDQKNDLSRLGIIHVVSVSGLHMALVYKILEAAVGYEFGILFSLVYAIFTGAQASTMRAFIMITVVKLSKKFYKKHDNLSSFALAAIILLFWKPFYISDLGFMLSFFSVLGIILCYDKLKRTLYKLPKILNESIAMTLGAQVFSTPYAVTYFKTFSFGFILGNLFLLPLYSILVVAGNIALIFIPFEYLFRYVNYAIEGLITVIDGGIYLLVNLCPPMTYFTYVHVVSVIILYIVYILNRHGITKSIYLAWCIIFLGFIDNYKLFPEIHYMNIGSSTGIITRYREHSVLVMDKIPQAMKDTDKLKGMYHLTDVRVCNGESLSVKLGSKAKINIKNINGINKKQSLQAEVITNNQKILITTKDSMQSEQFSKNYDIIWVKTDMENFKSYWQGKEIIALKVFPNKVYCLDVER